MALRKTYLAAATAMGLTLAAGAASHAQISYPERPVRIVVPFAPGGTADIVARIAAEQVGDYLGSRVYVENITGAGGSVGAAAAARAPADGYTLLLCNVSCAANQFLLDNPGFNPDTDLAPVVVLTYVPNILVTGPSVQARTLADFLALARANPGKLSMASSGPGSSSYLTAELLKFKARADIVDVPYRGSAGAMPDILAGRVDAMVMGLPESLPFIREGKLTALGVTSDKRAAALPDVPTLAEAGAPDYAFLGWLSLFVPQRTPPAAIEILNTAFGKALASPRLLARFVEQSMEPGGGTAELAGRLLRDDVELWGRVLRGRKGSPSRN
jgi:tripartite-type tricarboxylate transporter receptor subunit TctC